MNQPTVDRFRYPWRRMVPGEVHTVTLHWADGSNVSGSTFAFVLLDAFTGAAATPTVTYAVNMAGAATGTVIGTATIPAGINVDADFELRVRQNGETIIAGPVLFASAVVPVGP